MKRLLLLFAAMMLSIMLSAQTQTQQGYVKTKGRMVNGQLVPGQGLKGATVSIKGRTAVLVNTDNGAFSFPVPAQTFMFQSVQKNGYELVDVDALKKSYNYSTNPIYILMETPEQQIQDQLDSERKIRRTLQRRLQQREDELEALREANRITTEEYQQALQKLYADQQNNEQLIADMSKEYAQMDYDQMDELNQRINDAILNGQLTEADSLLRSKGDMKSRVAEIRREQQAEAQREAEIAQAQTALAEAKAGTQMRMEDIASDCKKFFDLCKLNMQWDSAAYYIETRAELDTTNVDWQYDAAYYFYQQNDFICAEKYFSRELTIVRKNQNYNNYSLSASLSNLAVLYKDTQRLTESEAMHLEALEICRRLAKDDPQTYENDLATTQRNLGALYYRMQRFTESEKLYLEALEIHRRLAKDNPQAYELGLAKTLNNLALLYSVTQRFTESEQMFLEIVDFFRRKAKDNPQSYEPDVAKTIKNLATLYYNTQRLTESEAAYLEALEIYRRLAKNNPQAYEPMLEGLFNDLAGLYYKVQRLDECEAMYLEALEIIRRLAQNTPQAYEFSLSMTLSNLGALYCRVQRFTESEKLYLEALEIRRRLAKDNPQAELGLAKTLNNLALLYFDTQRFTESEKLYLEALEIFRCFAKQNPSVYNYYLTSLLDNISGLYIYKKEFAKAEQYEREALAIDDIINQIASNFAATMLFQGKYDEAESVYRQFKDEKKNSFLQDFNDFEAAGVIPEERKADVERIKILLMEE